MDGYTDRQTDRHISTLAQRGHGWVAIQISRQHCKQFSLNQTLIVDRQTRMHSHAQDKQGPEACYLRNDFGTARQTKRACSSTALQRPSTNHTHLAERTGCEHKHAHRHTYTDTHWPLYLKLHYKLCRWWWSGRGATLLWGVTRQENSLVLSCPPLWVSWQLCAQVILNVILCTIFFFLGWKNKSILCKWHTKVMSEKQEQANSMFYTAWIMIQRKQTHTHTLSHVFCVYMYVCKVYTDVAEGWT